MRIFMIISMLVSLYVIMFLPSMVLYFVLGGVFVDGLSMIGIRPPEFMIQNLILIIPGILAGVIFSFKNYMDSSRYIVSDLGWQVACMVLGHVGLVGIVLAIIYGSQLAGWMAVPIYIWCTIFYGMGFIFTTEKMAKNA